MTRILIDAFAQGPWDRYVCPPHLKVKPGDGDVFDWRMHTLSSTLESPGRDTVLACRETEQEGEEIVGWAQWLDLSAGTRTGGTIPGEARAMMERELGPSAAAIDKEALSRLRREGLQLEESFEEYLGAERPKVSWRECNPKERSLDMLGRDEARVSMPTRNRLIRPTHTDLTYLVIDPKHQREGIGRLLAKEGLDRAADQGRDVCLRATPEGRRLYLALGFEQVREQKVIGESQFAMVLKASDFVRPG